MKRSITHPLFVFLFSLLSYYTATAQELVEQAPNVFIEDVFDISIQPSGVGIAIGSASSVLQTDDFGASWEQRPQGVQNPRRIEGIPGTNSSFLLLQFGGLERTTDGGDTWTDMELPEGPQNENFRISALPSGSVFYVASRERVLKTTDGGDTWTAVTPTVTDEREWVSLYFFSETEGLLSDDMGVLHYTNNGGASWTIRNNTTFTERFIINFRDANNGYAAHFRDLYQTSDGGTTWSLLLESAFGSHQDQILLINEQRMIFSQGALSSYITNDGGQTMETFRVLTYGGDQGFLHILPDGRIWGATDFGGIGYSDDGGLTYVDQNPGAKHGFLSIDITADNAGWAAGRAGQVVRTNNGGDNWNLIEGSLPPDPTSEEVPSIEHLQAYSYDEVLLASRRQIFYTADGGNSWETVRATTPPESFDAIATVGNTVWATESNGEGGFIHRSTDRGQNWETFEVGTLAFEGLRELSFHNDNLGFITGFNGMCLRTTDGGENWTAIDAFEDSDRLLAPFFLNEQEGWLVKDTYGSDLFHTTDGGDTWELLDMGTSTYWQKIHATEENGIYAFGGTSGTGRVVRSLDGGDTWELFISGSISSYSDYAYRATPTGFAYWVCGFGGFIGIYDATPVGTDELTFNTLNAYPNPASNFLQVELPANWDQRAPLQVYSLYGQLLHQQPANEQLDVSRYPAGTYLLRLRGGDRVYSTQLTIQR